MVRNDPSSAAQVDGALHELARLRRLAGSPSEFWPAFLAATGQLLQASRGIILVRDPKQESPLKKLSDWTDNGPSDRSALVFQQNLPEIAGQCARAGFCHLALDGRLGTGRQHFALGVLLPLPGMAEECAAAFLLPNATEHQAEEALIRLQLASDVPQSFQIFQTAHQAQADVEKVAWVLDLMVLVNAEKRFRAAALAFCNGLATRFQSDRASLGWVENGYVRLKAISRTERFDKNMSAVQSLETVMEEALDQNQEILGPAPEGFAWVSREHDRYAREQNTGHVASWPLRWEEKPAAVVTCERASRAFTPVELQQIRLAADQAVARLAELKRHDRWFGARWSTALREQLARLLGPERTWAKVLALTGSLALMLLCLPVYPYKVEGNFILRSDESSSLTAPFDSYIKSVAVRPGDTVAAGTPLLQLNQDELELEEAAALADQTRHLREAEKARATQSLAEMRIAQALADQAKAHLDLVRYRLDLASIAAPFDGVVVEGDLRQRVGSPVRQGDFLFRVARTDKLYVEAEINERDLHELAGKSEGQMAFVTQPKQKFPIRIDRIEPAAFPKEQENVFVVRCALSGGLEPWWRPGMSGVCKFPVEKRTLLWILTHRTVDFLRVFFWW